MMKPSQPHPYLAFFLDVWLLDSLLELVAGAWPQMFGKAAVVAVLAALGALLLYHLRWAALVRFLSVGEVVAGRVLEHGEKAWRTPYTRSRTLLYLAMLGTLWLTVKTGAPEPRSFAVEAGAVVLAAVSMLLVGRGVTWGLLGIWGYRVVEQVRSLDHLQSFGIVHVDLIAVGMAGLVVALYYSDAGHGTVPHDVTP